MEQLEDLHIRISKLSLRDSDLRYLDTRGLIVGPGENLSGFCRRVSETPLSFEDAAECLEISSDIHSVPAITVSRALDRVEALYGLRPATVTTFTSCARLPFWMGGCTWTIEREGVSTPLIHLAPPSRLRSLLGYGQEEVLAHELVHAARVAFNESSEELFAYRTSERSWRRWIGPLFESESSNWAWLLCIAFPIGLPLLLFIPGMDLAKSAVVAFSQAIPVLAATALVCRAYYRRRMLRRCCHFLRPLLGDDTEALCLRLSDTEMRLLAKDRPSNLGAWALERAANDLRWRQIYSRFFSPEYG